MDGFAKTAFTAPIAGKAKTFDVYKIGAGPPVILMQELPGRTLLLVTHRASLLSLVDRLIVMDGGRIMADGPRDKVLKALAQGQIRGNG